MRQALREALSWLYPPKCALCEAIGRPPLCEECLDEFVEGPGLAMDPAAPLAWALGLYAYEGRAAQAVRRLKYARCTALGEPLARLVADGLDDCPEVDQVVPVPIHKLRQFRRGFNQSDLLVAAVPEPLRAGKSLVRVRNTPPQVSLSGADRLKNLHGAFTADASVRGLRIALVDDVRTTGGTAVACADALIEAGARSVGILTVCVGEDR